MDGKHAKSFPVKPNSWLGITVCKVEVIFAPPVFQTNPEPGRRSPSSFGLLISVCQLDQLLILVITSQTLSLGALIVIVLLHFTGAVLLMLFICKCFCLTVQRNLQNQRLRLINIKNSLWWLFFLTCSVFPASCQAWKPNIAREPG